MSEPELVLELSFCIRAIGQDDRGLAVEDGTLVMKTPAPFQWIARAEHGGAWTRFIETGSGLCLDLPNPEQKPQVTEEADVSGQYWSAEPDNGCVDIGGAMVRKMLGYRLSNQWTGPQALLSAVCEAAGPIQDDTGVMEAFKEADANGDGVISLEELKDVFGRIGNWSDEEFEVLFQAAQTDDDGNLSYEEFVNWIMADDVANSLSMLPPGEGQVWEIVSESGHPWMKPASTIMPVLEIAEPEICVCPGPQEELLEIVEPEICVCPGPQEELLEMVEPMMCGGFGAKQPADAEIQAIADQVKDAAVEKANVLLMEDAEWKAVQYSCQVVAGTNYDIDVDTGNSGFVNIKVYVDLEDNAELTTAVYKANL